MGRTEKRSVTADVCIKFLTENNEKGGSLERLMHSKEIVKNLLQNASLLGCILQRGYMTRNGI